MAGLLSCPGVASQVPSILYVEVSMHAPPEQDIKPIVDAVHGAERPVLYVGGGCLDAAPELREFVARTGIPVAQTLMGLGAFPESDPLALQVRSGPVVSCTVIVDRALTQAAAGCMCWRTLRSYVACILHRLRILTHAEGCMHAHRADSLLF